jgi:CHAD domain-containing protein
MPALRKFARRTLRGRLRKLLRRAATALSGGDAAALHALRKECKGLRYNLEFFESLLGPGGAEAIELLTRVQDRLGTVADADAFGRTYAALLDGLKPDDPRRAGLLACRQSARARREKALASLGKSWSAEPGEAYPERLAASISSALGSLSPKSEA